MSNTNSSKEGGLFYLLQKEEQKYKEAIQSDLPFDEVKPIYQKMKELKNELDELTRKTELLNQKFSAEISNYENALKKLNDHLEQVKDI